MTMLIRVHNNKGEILPSYIFAYYFLLGKWLLIRLLSQWITICWQYIIGKLGLFFFGWHSFSVNKAISEFFYSECFKIKMYNET